MEHGNLFLCPTPIGNLKDITLRTIEVLNDVDYIAAEDTRRTKQLLNHLNIDKKIFSYYEQNKEKSGEQIISLIVDGKNIALVTDAGMPGISDPGEDLVKLCIENNIEITCLPGPSAFVNALVISGLDSKKFSFEGFLDRTKGKRKKRLDEIREEDRTLIFYEAPHRLMKVLDDLFFCLGDRKISISRELTKKFEETYRGRISTAIEFFKAKEPRGEFVIVVEGFSKEYQQSNENIIEESLENSIIRYITIGHSKKEAIKLVARDRNLPKNIVYKESLNIK